MTDTRQKCWVCDGRGEEYGETCMSCGGQGKWPFREWGKEDDEDQTDHEHVGDDYCKECGVALNNLWSPIDKPEGPMQSPIFPPFPVTPRE